MFSAPVPASKIPSWITTHTSLRNGVWPESCQRGERHYFLSKKQIKERKGKYDPADNFNLNPKRNIYINPHANKDQGTLLVRKQRECKSRHIDEVLWKSLQDVTLVSNHGQIIAVVTRQDLGKIKLIKACPRPCWLSSVVQLRKNWQ